MWVIIRCSLSCCYQISMKFVLKDHITTPREAGIWKLYLLLFHIIIVQLSNWSMLQNLNILLPHQAFIAFCQTKNSHALLQAYPNVDVQAGIQLGFPAFSYTTDWHLLGPSMSWQFHMHALCRAQPIWNIIYGRGMRQGSLWISSSNNPAPPDVQQDRRPRGQIPQAFVS